MSKRISGTSLAREGCVIYFHTLTTLCDGSGSRRACGGFEGALVEGIVLFVLVVMFVLVEG